jgi:hypothetical protein
MKKAIALFGLLGLVGCFLPLVPGFSMFDLRHLDSWQTYLLMAAFAAPMVAGLADKTVVASIVGTLGFGYLIFKFGTGVFDLVLHASIGGKMMAVAMVGGLACSLLGFAEARGKTA